MGFKDSLDKLEKSKVFAEWRKECKDCYLTHGFFMEDKAVDPEWQIGYYDPNKDLIYTFTVGQEIAKNPESEAFKQDGKIEPLSVDDVKLDYVDVFPITNEIQKTEYKGHLPLKKIFIVQSVDGRQVWNVTYVTQTFNTLNMKIDTKTGEVVSKRLLSIFRVEK